MTILTVTMNPSIDIAYEIEDLKIDNVNRVTDIQKTAGGKGLNVTRVLHTLGENVVATGVLGGKFGEYIKEKLSEEKIKHAFFDIDGETRNCIAILHNGRQTEILEKGPIITSAEKTGMTAHFLNQIKNVDVISISGSLPAGMEKDYYVKLLELCSLEDKKVVMDTSGESLLAVLKSDYKPTAIKPNLDELSSILNEKISDDIESLKKALESCLFEGIEWIFVSMGSKGMFAKHNNKYYRVEIPKINAINPVGSGDSTVAGISSFLEKNDEELLKHANVLGMLNAMESKTGCIDLSKYDELYKKIRIVEV